MTDLFSGQQAVVRSDESIEAVREQFVGNYELIEYEVIRRGGESVPLDYVGRIMYDEHGNMAAQGMPANLPERARASTETVRGGFAYFGTYRIDPAQKMVVHKVQGSPTRGGWVGEDNVRYYDFSGDVLTLSIKNAEGRVTSRLTWRRYQ